MLLKLYNVLIRCKLYDKPVNVNCYFSLLSYIYKVRQRRPILKGVKVKWLTFSPKSFPHLHETRSDNALQIVK